MNQSDHSKKRRIRITEKKKKSGGKICPKGIAWAKRTFDTYPSAYANLAASKYCKDPNYGKGRGKDAKNEELDPLLEEEEDSVDLSDQEVKKLKKVQDQLKGAVKAHNKQQKTIGDIVNEGELQKWVDEDWVRVTSSGKIAGKCGTSKDKKNPDRCLPRSKAQSLSKKERAATGKKKKAAQKSGKDSGKKSYVANTKKGKVTKKHTKRESLELTLEQVERIIDEEIATLDEKKKKKKKPCKKAKGKRYVKRVNGRCRSFGQAGKAKGGGDRIRPGTKKGDAYCARSAKIKKCKNPPCANDLSRKKWKCRGSKSMKE